MVVNYEERIYRRDWLKKSSDLVSFEVYYRESDLFILAERDLSLEGAASLLNYRQQLEDYISQDKEFARTFTPHQVASSSPEIVKRMSWVAEQADVGPMAAVAGAISEFVGHDLSRYSQEVIIENGGDIFIRSQRSRYVGIFAGHSPLSGKIGLEIPPGSWGVCTSSGTVGHSISFGQADACVVVSVSASLADAFATSIGNLIKTKADIQKGIDVAKNNPSIIGLVIIKDEQMGVWGKIKLIQSEIGK